MAEHTSKPERAGPAAQAFLGLAWLMVLGVAIQVYLAGYAVLADPAAWRWHTSFVHLVELFALLMALVAWLGKQPRRHLHLSLALLGLIWLQYALVSLSTAPLRALHAANALAIFAVALAAARAATGPRWPFS